MFQILKAKKRSQESPELVVKSSIVAKDVVKSKKNPKIACSRCRRRKMKCVVYDGSSCERCNARGLTCSDDQATGDPISGSVASEYVNDSPGTTSPTGSHIVSPRDGSKNEAVYNNYTPDSAQNSSGLHLMENTISDFEEYFGFIEAAHNLPIDFDICTPGIITDQRPQPFTTVQEQHTVVEPSSGERLCSCSDDLISTNAMMQVNVMWNTCPSSYSPAQIGNLLQCQTKLFNSLEALLTCLQCISKLDMVVLATSLCRDMLQATRLAEEAFKSGQGGWPPGLLERLEHSASDSRSTDGMGNMDGTGWQLGADEEVQMVRALIRLRTAKLKKLISQLEVVVSRTDVIYPSTMKSVLRDLADS